MFDFQLVSDVPKSTFFAEIKNAYCHISNVMAETIVETTVMKRMGALVFSLYINNHIPTYIFPLILSWTYLLFLFDISDFYMLRYSAGTCRIGEFVCNNRKCINYTLTCDSNNDCGDWSDEADCRGTILIYIILHVHSTFYLQYFDEDEHSY